MPVCQAAAGLIWKGSTGHVGVDWCGELGVAAAPAAGTIGPNWPGIGPAGGTIAIPGMPIAVGATMVVEAAGDATIGVAITPRYPPAAAG